MCDRCVLDLRTVESELPAELHDRVAMTERFALKLLMEIPADAAEDVRVSVEEHLEAIGAVGVSVELELPRPGVPAE